MGALMVFVQDGVVGRGFFILGWLMQPLPHGGWQVGKFVRWTIFVQTPKYDIELSRKSMNESENGVVNGETWEYHTTLKE